MPATKRTPARKKPSRPSTYSRPRTTVGRRPAARKRGTRRGRSRTDQRFLLPGVGIGLVLAGVLTFGIITGHDSLTTGDISLTCAEGTGVAGSVDTSALTIAGYSGEQLTNAAHIIDAGDALGLPRPVQVIAVMTAMGESGLRVIDYGDTVGPDSRGLFQQRDNGAWGSYADRMDPSISAGNFYRALMGNVPDWEGLPPTEVAHRVQRNADPTHYERWQQRAEEVVLTLTGQALSCQTEPQP